GRADEEGSPEWFVKRVLDNTITPKQLQSLSVSLRTQPIAWVKQFVEAQGQVALTNSLAKINKRQQSGPAAPDHATGSGGASKSERDLDKEYDIVKCLKALMNNKYGADNALQHDTIIMALCGSLTSPRLNTRKLVSELLTFLCHWAEGQGHLKVLQALDHLKAQQNENGRFDAWLRIVEVTIDGRGKMGSLVGASDEVRSGGIGMENLLMEYAVTSLFLINSIVDAPEKDLQLRCHIRAQFVTCGLKRIMSKMEEFQYEVIDKQIERYRTNEAIDYEDLLEREASSMTDSMEGEGKDLNDPVQIVEAIQSKLGGSRAGDYFLSALQHLLIMREQEGDDRLKMFQLVESMLSYVAMDRRLPDMDLKQSLNFTVQNLMDKLYTDGEARQAREEAKETRLIADAAVAERDEMKAQVELGADGLVRKLQQQVEEQQAVIDLQARQGEAFKAELAEVQRLRAQELQRNELETRELYLMLRDAQDVA
ncbi:FH2-domain-containing protein, partial [Hortaea werneckii]